MTPARGTGGPRSAGEAHLPRHRHELRRSAARLPLRGLPIARSARYAQPRRRGGRKQRGTRLLIDTPPELRLQLIAAGIDRVDAVLFTHAHADHTHGIDDLRAITLRRSAPLPIYGPAETLDELATKFRYIFDETFDRCPGRRNPKGKRILSKPGASFPSPTSTSCRWPSRTGLSQSLHTGLDRWPM